MDYLFNKTRKVGNYEIGTLCYESYPCKHCIRKICNFQKEGDSEWKLLDGASIYELLKSEQTYDAHFNCYAEYLRKLNAPTEEELQQCAEDECIIHEQQEAEQIEKGRIYKSASERLQKLHARINN